MARRDVYSLSQAEWDRLAAALNILKASGVYDDFTRRHQLAMNQRTLFPGETGTQRNVAHRGPSFLPWHRQFIRELELQLQAVDPVEPLLELPYWAWEREGAGWRTAPFWNLVGGNGTSTQGYRVTSGPFAGWTSIIFNSTTGAFTPRAGLIRRFKTTGSMPVFGGQSVTTYDVSPWNERSSLARSFRRSMENPHNTVHTNIGGDMGAGTSPNDPVFFFHHANCDRAWAEWQTRTSITNYQPLTGAPTGHNLNDLLLFELTAGVTISSVLDWRAMGYTYDTLG
jgi:tyrosinase